MVAGNGLEPLNPEGADLQSAAIATMRTRHVKERIYCIDMGNEASKKPMAISDA